MNSDIDSIITSLDPLVLQETGYLAVRPIVGPYDAALLNCVRRLIRPYINYGEALPAELFLLGVGEPETQSATKVGGLPYRPRDRVWPLGFDGQPLAFLAQINFRDSRDICGVIPDDVLLVFSGRNPYEGIHAEWANVREGFSVVTNEDVPENVVRFNPFYGVGWRTSCYPNAEETGDSHGGMMQLPDGRTVLQAFFATELLGLQIGARPFTVPGNIYAKPGERILCSICSIYPSEGVPYAFVNRPNPLTREECDEHSLVISNIRDSDGFGVIHILINESSDLRIEFHNL